MRIDIIIGILCVIIFYVVFVIFETEWNAMAMLPAFLASRWVWKVYKSEYEDE